MWASPADATSFSQTNNGIRKAQSNLFFCLTLFIIGAFLTLQIFGQTIAERAQMKALPAVKVWELYVENAEHPKVRAEIFDAMFKDERIDVITFFFYQYYTLDNILEAVVRLPDSEYKNKIVLTLLRGSSAFWLNEDPVYDGSRGATYNNAVEPFVGVIRKYLPETVIDEKLFSTKAGRLKLAADIESAMAKSELSVIEQATPPKKDSELATPTGVLPKPDVFSVPAGSDSKPPPKATPSRMPLFVAAGFLLALPLLWLLLKNHNRQK